MKAYFVKHNGTNEGLPLEGRIEPHVIVFNPGLDRIANDIRSRVGAILVQDEMWGETDKDDASLKAFLTNELERLSRTYSGKTILVITHDRILQCLAKEFRGQGTGENGDPMLVQLPDRPGISGIKRATDPIL
jgi:hypothetical protein